MKNKELKILTVGNSFGVDTSHHLPDVARSAGYERVRVCVLYIGGCSLNRHFENAQNDLPVYRYYVNEGEEWICESEEKSIREAVAEDDWDFISIQHGTKDGSRYTLPASYERLPALIDYVKQFAPVDCKIAFNMAWVMEPDSTHPEIRSYGGDQMQMYCNLIEVTKSAVLGVRGLDILSPAGTAIQNARTSPLAGRLSRDGFHLSLGIGRYLASLTFLKALTGADIGGVLWCPDGVTEEERLIAIQCATHAVESPFSITTFENRKETKV